MEGRFMSMVLQPKASIIKKTAVAEEAPAAETREQEGSRRTD